MSDVALMNLCRRRGSKGSSKGMAGLERRRSTEAPRVRIAVGMGGGGSDAEGSRAACRRSISRGNARARFPPAESPARIAISFAASEACRRVGRSARRMGRESAAGDLGARG